MNGIKICVVEVFGCGVGSHVVKLCKRHDCINNNNNNNNVGIMVKRLKEVNRQNA